MKNLLEYISSKGVGHRGNEALPKNSKIAFFPPSTLSLGSVGASWGFESPKALECSQSSQGMTSLVILNQQSRSMVWLWGAPCLRNFNFQSLLAITPIKGGTIQQTGHTFPSTIARAVCCFMPTLRRLISARVLLILRASTNATST
jgi:hypothetical protein